MRIYIDTEFNEYKGELISLALVAENGSEWYGVREMTETPGPWVAKHVIPVLGHNPTPDALLKSSLAEWLSTFNTVHIIADWPEDISHFCNFLITGPGERIGPNNLSFAVIRDLPNTAEISKIPHNALEDARSLKKAAEKKFFGNS
jgi:hypothetical protein